MPRLPDFVPSPLAGGFVILKVMLLKPALDRLSTYKRDSLGIYRSILGLPKQLATTWAGVQSLSLPDDLCHVNQIVVAGMGGSALGARVVRTWAESQLSVPLTISTDYSFPGFVNSSSLVILSSYSGNTEEVLNAASEAQSRQAKIFCISQGGQLEKLAQALNWPAYFFSAEHNPSNQPRMGVGINLTAVAALLGRLGFLDLSESQVNQAVSLLEEQQRNLGREVVTQQNFAKKMAQRVKGRGLVLIGARHLRGAVHVVKNQLNEGAKTFAARFDIPELNHHLLEGLTFPKQLKNDLHFVLFDSLLYPAVLRKRSWPTATGWRSWSRSEAVEHGSGSSFQRQARLDRRRERQHQFV